MNKRYMTAVLCAAVCLSGVLCGCTAAPESTPAAESSAASESSAESQEEPAAETTAPESSEPETETSAPETEPESEPVVETVPETTRVNKVDHDTKILASERGLEAVPINKADGYGEELKVGDSYLGWKLEGFNGELDDSAVNVTRVDADFTYTEGTLAVNGIVTVLPKDDPDNPNAMYLRVDNQGDFPWFPKDLRERGRYIIENSRDVFPMLELQDPPVDEKYEIAVSVTVSTLHIHAAPGCYDTIRVTAASKR